MRGRYSLRENWKNDLYGKKKRKEQSFDLKNNNMKTSWVKDTPRIILKELKNRWILCSLCKITRWNCHIRSKTKKIFRCLKKSGCSVLIGAKITGVYCPRPGPSSQRPDPRISTASVDPDVPKTTLIFHFSFQVVSEIYWSQNHQKYHFCQKFWSRWGYPFLS